MTGTLFVALDILREASKRRWMIAMMVAITLLLLAVALTLRMEVVDGALAATRLFGKSMGTDIVAPEVALRPVFRGATYVVFYGGLAFGILSCADFAPDLFSPGRIEHLLALPLRRWELLGGTFLGVFGIALVSALYGSSGLCLVLGVKTGVWTISPVIAAIAAAAGFAGVYGAMLASAVFVRSAALSAAVGGVVFVSGILAGFRDDIVLVFDEGPARIVFRVLTAPLPRISALADVSARFAGGEAIAFSGFGRLLVGLFLFGAACLALGMWHFERKDF